MTNVDKIIALLAKSPGLDDDEISSHTNIRPRQQVNQICRRLESQGQIRRVAGPRGKVVNYWVGNERQQAGAASRQDQVHRERDEPVIPEQPRSSNRAQPVDSSGLEVVGKLNLRTTLVLIPCSGRKVRDGLRQGGQSITDVLPRPLSEELQVVRKKVAEKSKLDESTLLPAWMRYEGTLYQLARPALQAAVMRSLHLAILSGGYGLALATEPIGYYERLFKYSDWPNQILQRVLLHYIREIGVRDVVAIVSGSTAYRDFLNRVNWRETEIQSVSIIAPEAGTGAMVKAPRAQGEALSDLLKGTLNSSFRSSDGLRMEVQRRTLR